MRVGGGVVASTHYLEVRRFIVFKCSASEFYLLTSALFMFMKVANGDWSDVTFVEITITWNLTQRIS